MQAIIRFASASLRKALLVPLLLCIATAIPAWAAETLTFYVVPQFAVDEIFRTWSPIVKMIGERAGVELQLKIPASIPAFERELLDGQPDLAYMNPYHAVMSRSAWKYEPIVCDAELLLSGILVVPADSDIRSLKQLEGREIAFPSPNSFGASLYLRALLNETEHVRFKARYVSTHSNVYRFVVGGGVVAGGGIRQTLLRESPDMRDRLRILYETPKTLPHPIAVHPRVDPRRRLALQQAILALSGNPGAGALLAAIQMRQPRAVSYADYAPLERLRLEKYVVAPAN